ncbi:MAG: STAS domain-containing protein [Anaerolineales bacterium]|nr:STAS domain-containing protein [Anaerolineales bacterium]
MTIQHFETIEHQLLGWATINLCGDLTAQAMEALNAAYTALESQNFSVIFFNFAGVNYINSGGIALLISLLARARQNSRTLMAYGLCSFHAELFQLAGLNHYMPILSSETGWSEPASFLEMEPPFQFEKV